MERKTVFPIGLTDRGDAVADVQRRLCALGYSVGPSGVDGVFAEETRNAVSTFQSQRNLDETGVVDEDTWRSLVEATVKLGDRLLYLRTPFFHGDDVRELQERLNTLGFNCGAVDGIFGRMTERAVRDFQTNMGLPADGIVGEATLGAVRKLRNITDSKSATSLPRRKPRPFSSAAAFRQRRVRVAWSSAGRRDAEQAWSQDLAGRLRNLLELLGADVSIGGSEEVTKDASVDACVAFDVDAAAAESGFRVEAIGGDSVTLAETVSSALSASVTEMRSRGVVPCDGAPPASTVVVRLDSAPGEQVAATPGDEALAQKVAVAVFDGLHAYFRRARHEA